MGEQDSNLRPSGVDPDALPSELSPDQFLRTDRVRRAHPTPSINEMLRESARTFKSLQAVHRGADKVRKLTSFRVNGGRGSWYPTTGRRRPGPLPISGLATAVSSVSRGVLRAFLDDPGKSDFQHD